MKEEKEKQQDFTHQAKQWQEAEVFRNCIKSTVQRALQAAEQIESFRKFNEWTEWGLHYTETT